MNATERLIFIKEAIDEAKQKQSETKGQISAIESQILAKFKVKGLEEAEKKLNIMSAELDKKEKEFSDGMQELESAYEWNT